MITTLTCMLMMAIPPNVLQHSLPFHGNKIDVKPSKLVGKRGTSIYKTMYLGDKVHHISLSVTAFQHATVKDAKLALDSVLKGCSLRGDRSRISTLWSGMPIGDDVLRFGTNRNIFFYVTAGKYEVEYHCVYRTAPDKEIMDSDQQYAEGYTRLILGRMIGSEFRLTQSKKDRRITTDFPIDAKGTRYEKLEHWAKNHGASILFNPKSQVTTITYGSKSITIPGCSNTILINKRKAKLDGLSAYFHNSWYVPEKSFNQALN